MLLTKKSIKWLIAAIVVFALVLTAVFAAGTVATAKADSETPVAALARFTGDRAHFRKTLEMLAKSVSASAAADALDG